MTSRVKPKTPRDRELANLERMAGRVQVQALCLQRTEDEVGNTANAGKLWVAARCAAEAAELLREVRTGIAATDPIALIHRAVPDSRDQDGVPALAGRVQE